MVNLKKALILVVLIILVGSMVYYFSSDSEDRVKPKVTIIKDDGLLGGESSLDNPIQRESFTDER